jgi:hypothetical protein
MFRKTVFIGILLVFSQCVEKQKNPAVTKYHTEKIFIGEEDKDPFLRLLIPDGYRLGKENGLDFLIFYAVPVDTTGLKSKATLGIYIGHHPNPIYPEGDTVILTTSETGSRFRWNSWVKTEKGSRTIIADALDDKMLVGIMPWSNMGNVTELQIHFFINATDENVTRLLMRCAESMELVRPK